MKTNYVRWKKIFNKKSEEENNNENLLSCDCNCCANALSSRTIHSRHTATRDGKKGRNNVNIKERAFNSIQGKYLRWAKKTGFDVNDLLSLNLIANGIEINEEKKMRKQKERNKHC